ncbi:MAG: formate dehydrogenase accessory sulfurtransferase FdhD [Terrimicrobiaceae bacterium]
MPIFPHTSLVRVRRIDGERAHSVRDNVAVEDPLEIQVAQERNSLRTIRSVSVTMRTPGNDAELAAGFLFGEGLLNQSTDVAEIEFPSDATNCVRIRLRPGLLVDLKRLDRNFYTTSSCGVCGKASLEAVRRVARGARSSETGTFRVQAGAVHQMPARLRELQRVFERTGGLHAAALFDRTGELCLLREDVGRHNAVDKVVGAEWLEGHMPIADRILFVSGRASFELVQKAVRAGIPVLAAVGAPSSLAVELAEAFNLTLLGFVRDGRFNIYSADYRISDAGEVGALVR